MSSEYLFSGKLLLVYWQIGIDVSEALSSYEVSVTFCRLTDINMTGDLNVQDRCAASVYTGFF